ncbi:MAG: IS200/IS605 family transposase [Deltaproteobacteria bacterium]|nr:IS200/IS605 family transposase [Deltaproteobacteria bacterium]
MSIYIHKSHNVSVLLYHIVCPAKYRKIVLSDEVYRTLKETCVEISKRYEMHFVEIGADKDHVHFLVQSVPTYSPTKIVRTIKSITAREVFRLIPSVKKELWGGEFWTDGYYINTVSKRGNEDVVRQYVKKQGTEDDYKQLHCVQLKLI